MIKIGGILRVKCKKSNIKIRIIFPENFVEYIKRYYAETLLYQGFNLIDKSVFLFALLSLDLFNNTKEN